MIALLEEAMSEVWKPVPGFEGRYEVSSLGRVRSLVFKNRRRSEPKMLKQCRHKFGHYQVTFFDNDRSWRTYVHRLVLAVFTCPPPFEGAECRHLNGDPSDNRIENLAWGTAKENGQDKVLHGNSLCGEKSPRAKLTDEEAMQIRWLCDNKILPHRKIADLYGVGLQTIRQISCRQSWKHLPEL